MSAENFFETLTSKAICLTNASYGPAMYEMLAEECTELAKAALKKARKMRNENYTPMTMGEIDAELLEETTDVCICICGLKLPIDMDQMKNKLERWAQRIKMENNDGNED